MARIAVALGEDFEDSEFSVPRDYLSAAGHELMILGSKKGQTVHGKRHKAEARIEAEAGELQPDDFDALLIPGGYSPDHLRLDESVVDFVRRFDHTGKPMAVICHGPQLLIEAETVRDRKMTSWPSVRTDLINAGAHWTDQQVVVDGNLITSRKPDDLNVFCEALGKQLS